jgi:hypothetical protein
VSKHQKQQIGQNLASAASTLSPSIHGTRSAQHSSTVTKLLPAYHENQSALLTMILTYKQTFSVKIEEDENVSRDISRPNF